MPIKNKDGSIFKLQGVNPLMKEQDHWDGEWQVHYVESEKVVVQDPQRTIHENMFEDKMIPAIAGVGIINQTEILYCLPLIIHTEVDPLYGQVQKTSSWGDKFNFEAIRIDCTGLTALFFARLPPEAASKVTVGSVIYVFKERQWWKVNGTEPSQDGINIYCMPSEIKPSFV